MNQSKISAETLAPVKDQTASPLLRQPSVGAACRKNRRGESGGTSAGNVKLHRNGKAENAFPDAAELSQQIAEITQKSRKLVAEFLKRPAVGNGVGMAYSLAIGAAFLDMTTRLMSDPSRLVQAQLSLRNDYLTLWQRTTQSLLGWATEPVIEPPAGDRRFPDVAWTHKPLFDFIKQ